MKRILQVFCAIFSGFIIALAISNEFLIFGSPLLGLVTLIPLYIALSYSDKPIWSGFLTALYMFTQHMLSSYWLGNFKDFAIFTLGASAIGTAIIGLITGMVLHIAFSFSKGTNKLRESCGCTPFSIPLRVICFACFFTLIEWVKSNGFIAYPWGTLVMTAYKWKLLSQIVDITGTWGISFLFSSFSAVLAEGILLVHSPSYNKRTTASYAQITAFVLSLFLCSTLYGVYQYTHNEPVEKTASIVLVQANGNSWTDSNELTAILNSEKLTDKAIKEVGYKPDLIVWNESVISSRVFPNASKFYLTYPEQNPLRPFIDETDIPFVIGGPFLVGWDISDRPQIANSALFFDKDGFPSDFYGKMHLVPFAEYIPFSEYPIVQKILNRLIGFSDGWTPGIVPELFEVEVQNSLTQDKTIKIGCPVCFDDAFPSVCGKLFKAGADVLVNITNDSWSATNSAEYQHFVISSFRAIEYRIPLVRAATAGYTVAVDTKGRIIADLPLFTEDAMVVDVPITKRIQTTYSRLGDWLPWTCLILTLLFGLFNTFIQKKQSLERKSTAEKMDVTL